MKIQRLVFTLAVFLGLVPGFVHVQAEHDTGKMTHMEDMAGSPKEHPISRHPFYEERTFHVLVGFVVAGAGYSALRIARRRWPRRRVPVEFVNEAVLVVDLVDSTHLATHYGDIIAMHARNILKERTLEAAGAHGLAFAEDTGDGYLMTFPRVEAAVNTAAALLKDLKDRPPDLSPGPALEARVGISYGQILLDGHASRHGATINKAFRLEGLSVENFTQLEVGTGSHDLPDRNRIFVDEEAAHELRSSEIPLRPIGYCRLKGFWGLHRVYEVKWRG